MKVSRTNNRQHHIYRHKDPSPVNVRHFNVVSRNYRNTSVDDVFSGESETYVLVRSGVLFEDGSECFQLRSLIFRGAAFGQHRPPRRVKPDLGHLARPLNCGQDFWRGLALQRELASVAESAAIAAASGIDEVQYRTDGSVVLDAGIARDLALSSIDFQDVDLTEVLVDVSPDGSQVTVFVEGEVPVGLMGVFVDDSSPLRVRAEATAFPRLVP